MKLSKQIPALIPIVGLVLSPFTQAASTPKSPPCRFALKWSQDDVLARPDDFISDLLYWEGKFHQDEIAYNKQNGMSYDGTQIDWETGLRTEKHTFSAASKEVSTRLLHMKVQALTWTF